MKVRNVILVIASAWVALTAQAIQTAGSLLINIDAASLSFLANNAVVTVWTNSGSLAGQFFPVNSGQGPVYSNNVAGAPAVIFAGVVNSVMTNAVAVPASICNANDWSFEVWVNNPALATTEDVFTWTARNMWPANNSDGSCMEFRFGSDSGNAVEHYGSNNNVPWGTVPSANAWHHMACARDSAGVDRLYVDGKLWSVFTPLNPRTRTDGMFTLGGVRDFAYTNSTTAWANYFSGALSKLRIHDGALSANQVVSNYFEERGAFGVAATADSVWQGGDGLSLPWSDSANWMDGLKGTNNTKVIIDNGGTAVLSAGDVSLARLFPYRGGLVISNGASITVPATAGANIYMGSPSASAFSFVVNEGRFAMPGTANHYLYLGNGSGATVNASIGGGVQPSILEVDKDIIWAASSNSVARATMNAGASVFISNGWHYVGYAYGADAKLTVNEGVLSHRLSSCDIVVGANGSRGVLEINGGSVLPTRDLVWATGTGYATGYGAVQLNGGLVNAYRLYASTTTGTNLLFLNGGTIRSRDSRSDFLQSLRAAYVQAGGAVFDIPTNTIVTATQPLLGDTVSTGGGLTKFGTGMLILSGSNTFTGNITVNAGGLLLRNAAGLAAGYAGTISLSNNAAIGLEKAGGVATLLAQIPADMQGSLTLFSVNAAENVDYSSRPNMGLGFYGNVIYTGTFTPYASSFVFSPVSTNNVFSQVIASGSVTVNGSANGVLELTGNNSYAGGTVINGGTLVMSHANALGVATGAPDIAIYNGSTLKLNATGIASDIGQRITADSQGFILLGAASTNVVLDLTGRPGLIVGTDQNTLNFRGVLTPATNTYRVGGGKTPYRVSDKQGLVLTNLVDGAGPTARQVVVEYDGIVRLSTGNTYSGGTVVTNKGSIFVREDAGLGAIPPVPSASNLFVNGGALRNADANFSLNVNRGLAVGPLGMELHPWGGYTMTVLGDLSGSGGIFTTDSGSVFFGGTNNTWGGALDIQQGTIGAGAGSTFSWNKNAVIAGAGSFGVNNNMDLIWSDKFALPLGSTLGLRKLGSGVLTVDVTPTYTKDTSIEGGTLKTGVATAIPAGSGKGNVSLASANARLDINGLNNVAVNGLSGTGCVTDSLATATQFTAGSNGVSSTFNGSVQPSITLVKTGSGTLTLSTAASVPKARVDQGVLAVGWGVASTGAVAISSAAALRALNTNEVFGLIAEYFDCSASGNQWVTETSNFVSLARITQVLSAFSPALTISSASFGATFDTLSNGSRFQGGYAARDYFVVRWTGRFLAETSGSYTFGTASDDGSMIFVDGQTGISNNNLQGYGGSQRFGSPLTLSAGWHDIQIVFFDKTADNAVTAYLIAPGSVATNTLPQRLLRPVSWPSRIGELTGSAGGIVDFAGPSAMLQVYQRADSTYPGRIVGTNTAWVLDKRGSATLTLAGEASEFVGQTEIREGTLALKGAGVLGASAVEMTSPGTLSVQRITNTVANTGLIGYYSWATINYNNYTSAAVASAYFATVSNALVAGSHLAGANFDFGTSGTGFPAPFNLGGSDVVKNFQVLWKGKLLITEPGIYSFTTYSDDGSMIFIDGATVVNNNNAHAMTEVSGSATLTAGTHDIMVIFSQAAGGYGMQANVTPPGGAKVRLPNSMLRPSVSAVGPLGAFTVSAMTNSGPVQLADDGAFLRVNQTTNRLLASAFSGPNASQIEKNGPARLTLGGNNDAFLGTWYLCQGELRAGDGGTNGTLGGSNIVTCVGTTLVFDRSDSITYTGIISGKGSIQQAGTGRVTLTAVATNYSGAVNLTGAGGLTLSGSNAVLNASSISATPPAAVTLASGASLLSTSSALTVPFDVVQSGVLKVTGDTSMDRLTLNGGSTLTVQYAGSTANANYALNVATIAVTNGTGTVVMSPNGTGSGTLKIATLEISSNSVLAVSGKVAAAGATLTVKVPQEVPYGSTLVADFSATDGLDVSGVTLTAVGTNGKLVYRNKRLYISRPNGILVILK